MECNYRFRVSRVKVKVMGKHLPYVFPYSAGTIEAKVRCDDIAHTIYVDGKLVGNTTGWTDVWKQYIADDAKLIAVECENVANQGGLIVSFGNGLTTDNTWRCSGENVHGWYDVDFDDSDWERASIIELNEQNKDIHTSKWLSDRNFLDKAKWVWKNVYTARRERSYCRGRLSK